MLIFSTIVGLAVLVIGRQLFWVAVSGLGFIIGLTYTSQYLQGSPYLIVLISLGVGLIGAILAYALEKAAAGLVGFLAGWYLIQILLVNISWDPGDSAIIFQIIGGLIGLVLIMVVFDWSLIILSSLAGATMIVQSIQFQPSVKFTVFLVLLILGLSIQGIMWMQEQNDF